MKRPPQDSVGPGYYPGPEVNIRSAYGGQSAAGERIDGVVGLPDATNEEGGSGWLDDIDGGRVTMAFADALTRRAEKLAAGTHSMVSDLGIKDAAEQAVA